jgi:hypothetical protein
MSDHHSLTYLLKQRNLSRRQARWTEILADFDLHFEYIKGEDNTVADALSRKGIDEEDPPIEAAAVASVAALTELGTGLSDSLKFKVREGYKTDPFCLAIREALPLRKDCLDVDRLLFIEGRLVIPATGELRHNLMNEAHNRLGHLGYLKTITDWPRMAKQVAEFVESCPMCQRTKC